MESGGQDVPKPQRRRQDYSGKEKERNLIVPEWGRNNEEKKEMEKGERRGKAGDIESSHTLPTCGPTKGTNRGTMITKYFVCIFVFVSLYTPSWVEFFLWGV